MEPRISLITLGVADLAVSRTFYGGYAGCFTDPDGQGWEIAHNPGFPLDEAGNLTIPDLG